VSVTGFDVHIYLYIQQDATLHGLFYLETALHVSGSMTTHNQEHKQLYLQHLVFVILLLLPAAVAAVSSKMDLMYFSLMKSTFQRYDDP
jgi:hypothetical protein